MPSRYAALLAVCAVLATTTSAAAQLFWLTIEGPARAFTVQMPGKPQYTITPLKSPAGTTFDLHSYLLTNGPIDYVAQMETYPADVDVSQPKAVLQAALDATAPYLATAKWDKVTWTTVQGAPAADAMGRFRDGRTFRDLVVLKGRQLFSLGFRAPVGMDKIMDADHFFTSLKVTP